MMGKAGTALSWSFWPRRMLRMPATAISILPSPQMNNEETKYSSFLVRVLNNCLLLLHRCSELRVQMILIIGIFEFWTLCIQTQLSDDYLLAYLIVNLLIWVSKIFLLVIVTLCYFSSPFGNGFRVTQGETLQLVAIRNGYYWLKDL